MSTEPIAKANTSAIPEAVNTAGAGVTEAAPDDAPKQTNGASRPAEPDGASQPSGDSKSTDAPGPVDTAKSADEPPPGVSGLDQGVDSHERAGEGPEAPNTGDKRELESTPVPTDTNKPVTESSSSTTVAPTAKKQKTDEDAGSENGTQTNGENKKAGRPKKVKETVKKVIPTDGIGSRTRSRTKAVS